jgi:excisionase family DNA binding protein
MNRQQFVARYQARRDEYAKVSAWVDGVQLVDQVLADFALLCQEEDDAELTLEEAASESGYSTDHLRRLVRLGKLHAYRHGRRLYFRRADLPKKPGGVDGLRLGGYDPRADARRVATRTSRGGTDG